MDSNVLSGVTASVAGEPEALLRLSVDWVWSTDSSGRVDSIRPIAPSDPERSGAAPLDIVGMLLGEALECCETTDSFSCFMGRQPFYNAISALPTENGAARIASVSGMPRTGPDGRFAGFTGTARNLAKAFAVAGDSAQAPSRGGGAEQLMMALNEMADAFCYYDRNDRLALYNEAYIELYAGLGDVVRQGARFDDLVEAAIASGFWDTTGEADPDWRGYSLSRNDDGASTVLRTSDGRYVLRRQVATEDGGRIAILTDVSDLKRREAEITLAKERTGDLLSDMKRTIDSMHVGVVVVDAELRVELVNRAFYALWKLAPDQVGVGCDFRKLMDVNRFNGLYTVHDRDWEAYVAGRVTEIRAGDVAPREFVRGDGSTIIYSVVSLSGGKRLVCYSDVTDLKRRERDAEMARRQLESVIDSMPAGIVIFDRDDQFVLSNAKAKEALPASLKAMPAKRTLRETVSAFHDAGYFRQTGSAETDGLYDTDREAWIDAYCARYHVRQAVSERQSPDGRWFQVHDTRNEDGIFVGVRVDITELKQREETLRETTRQNELFRNLIDSVPVAIYAKTPDLKLVYVNNGWCQLTGYRPDEALGRTDIDIFGDDGIPFTESDRQILRTGEMMEVEEETTLADGSTRHQIARKRSMTASDGSLYLIGSTSDVTDLKRREAELSEARQKAELADRAKSEFLANMSHEIRTPMNGVLGMAELLAKSTLDAKQATFVDIIVKSGNSLLTIINDILDFSKIDAGQLVLDPAPFSLSEAIEDVATLMSTRAKEKDLEMIARVDPSLPEMVVGDPGRLRQIITNMMGNAVKFTEAGHVLAEVTGARVGDEVSLRFAVTDTGIGIPADKLDLVFEKFSQVDGSSTRRHEGTGLGLAISSRLVALMGGRIGVSSTEGRGSTFWFEITLPAAEGGRKRKVAPMNVTGARVLIVDDNAVNRAILSEQMTSWSFDSCAATSGPEGIAVLKAAAAHGVPVDCVVLDYQMPGMNGADAAALIRATPEIAETPILLLTSVDQSLNQTRTRSLAIDAQLIKPARSSVLLDALVGTIQRRRWAAAGEDPMEIERQQPACPPPPMAAERSSARRAATSGLHRVDVLIAEDNDVNQLVFTQILEETDLTFEIVANGRLAVEAAGTMTPRMILMDVSMPEMNGLEATAAIRAAEEASGDGWRVPIVGVTAHALKGDRERCLDAGMDDYLSKPIKPSALSQKIDYWLGRAGQASRAG